MNEKRIVSVLAAGCLVSSVLAQVVPQIRCCDYIRNVSPPSSGGEACGTSTTTVSMCETGSVGTSAPDGKEEKSGNRPAICQLFDIGDQGSWINIPCGSLPQPPYSSAVFVGKLSNGSCCWAYRPGGGEVVFEWENTPIKVAICEDDCDGGGVH